MSGKHSLPLVLVAASALLLNCARDEIGPTAPTSAPPSRDLAQEADIIPGQYIILFRDDVPDPLQLAGALASAHGLTLRHTYRTALRGFSAEVPEAALAGLRRTPQIESISPNRWWYIDTHERLQAAGRSAALAAPPPAPSGLATSAVSANQIDLLWLDNSDNEREFEIERGPSSTGPFSKVGTTKTNVTTFSDTELNPETQYCYRVLAVAGRGKNKEYSGYSDVDCATTLPGSPPADGRPTDLTANAASSTQIDLAWTDHSDETGFKIERCQAATSGSGCANFAEVAETGSNATAYGDGSLTAETEYCYRVRGVKARGKKVTYTEYSNTACATTQASPPSPPDGDPSGLSATAVSASAVDLVWTDNSSNEDGFEIERHAGDGSFTVIAQTAADATFYQDAGLSPSTTYTYRVRGFNADGFSDYSNTAAATTDAPPPPGSCSDTGNHDDLTELWNIRKVKAHLNAKWQATQQQGCQLTPWFFGLDSGVDTDHPDLNVVEAVSFLNDGSNGEDGNGHGTHTAGTAAGTDGDGGVVGVAPGAPVHAFKVCNNSGQCPEDAILAAIDEVTQRKTANPSQPMVANMSLGGMGSDEPMEGAIRQSINAGVVYAISAGNGFLGGCWIPDDAQFHTPARVGDDNITASGGSSGDTKRANGAITTTSTDANDVFANCNYGNPVTVAAPGVGVKSSWLNGGYSTISGTSMAAPHAAGAAILYLQDHPTATPAEVEQAIMDLLDPWDPVYAPNADGRLNVENL